MRQAHPAHAQKGESERGASVVLLSSLSSCVLGAAAMSGFGAGGAPPRSVSSETLEKIDMSLDDIIKLNKKEERKQYPPRMKRGLQQAGKRQFRMRRTKWGIQEYTGFGKNRLGRRKRVAGKRPPYGVKTGLAARKALGSLKGISPLNRSPLSEKNIQRNYSVLKRKTTIQRQSELQRKQGAILRRPTLLNRRTNIQSPSARIGNKLYQQKDARQATFLFKRGLKVQAQVHPEDDLSAQVTNRTRPWRTSTTNGGILTVSIDNPGAVPSPILKPRLTSTPVPPFLMKRDQSEEKKIPKGVPLQFDINSVGKQTNMTLNERFGILKEQRTALSQNKGSRFVTVG
ncbi:UAP56-interacting factor isoform X2 [Lacerta agilis]|uniref:UAP56-interacting factor isoform X2 n=1 Tax=Lacerta agilis TaxID=80427 RepID=UPI001419E68F|nr:UAP56-interacting factor isoform X2 [Lacerta agilis]